ncbi:MAG: hypothetical protein LBU53_07630 [Zoogloeaceae bacterium]|nr:hypothetical protein [Zoogloeaceae bacterium]
MPFITGQAGSLQGLLDALTTAITAHGWTDAGGGCYTKDGCAVRLELLNMGSFYGTTQYRFYVIRLVVGNGVSGGALVDGAPIGQFIGEMEQNTGYGISFPATFSIHINQNPDEVYFFVNHNVTYWQWLAFGRSPVPGIPGTGNWSGGTRGAPASGVYGAGKIAIYITPTGGTGGTHYTTSTALFWDGNVNTEAVTSIIHHGLSGDGWQSAPSGAVAAAPRIEYGISTWNQGAPLIPIRALLARGDTKNSIISELRHARYLRLDHYAPGEVITLGQDKWRVYPWWKKNITARNGGTNIDHTGTFGVALRYDGA